MLELPIPREQDLRRFGFWRSQANPDLPHPSDYVDLQWDDRERQSVVNYLRRGWVYTRYMGWSTCRFGCESVNMGTADFTDGVWLFPEGLAHYVDIHAVKPPVDFLEHMRANDYRIPDIPGLRRRQR